MTFGVTPEGFRAKDLEIIIDELEQDQRKEISAAINTQADSLLGILNGIFGDKIAELWEVQEDLYRANHPDFAEGDAQDNVAAITGAERLAAASSEVTLSLNLDAATTVPINSIVRIGATGERWLTSAAVTNGGSDQATVTVDATSENTGTIAGNAYSIDSIVTPVSGWSAKAAINNLNVEPFPLADLYTLLLEVDEGQTQTVVFRSADFISIAAATAQEVIDAIAAATTGISGLDVSGFIRIFSDTDGSGSAIRVVGGTAAEALGFSQDIFKGFNQSSSAKIINANNEPYNLSGGPTLAVAIDGGTSQVISFTNSDFGVHAIGNIVVVAASALASGVDTDTFVLNDGANPAVTFIYDDDGSVVETATTRAINHNGIETITQIRDLTIAAINNAPTLAITASNGPTISDLNLINDATGVAGNVAIIETVANVSFIVAGMAGGVNDDAANATAILVAKAINSQLSGGVAYEVGGKVQIESLTVGLNSRIEVTGGTSNGALGYTLNDEKGGSTGDATEGREVESSSAFRLRRNLLLQLAGSGTVPAVRSAVLKVDNVSQVFVFENYTDITSSDGLPPHSIEVVAEGGDDTEIAQAISTNKPAGTQTYKVPGPNGVTVSLVDSQGVSNDIKFSRPNKIEMHVIVDVTVNASLFGSGSQSAGEQEVRDAIEETGGNLEIGQDVVVLVFRCAPLSVAGVLDVTSILIEDVDPPTNSSNIAIAGRELATFSTANIDVNVTFV